jgi:hypothetical protein
MQNFIIISIISIIDNNAIAKLCSAEKGKY